MTHAAAFLAAALGAGALFAADPVSPAAAAPGPDIVERAVELKSRALRDFTVYLKKPSAKPAKGVLCLCLLGRDPASIRSRLRATDANGEVARLVRFADGHGFAILAWGVRNAWDSRANWNELSKDRARAADETFDAIAEAWNRAVKGLVAAEGLPADGWVMWGLSAGGQFAMRLALRRPERFASVHAHVPSSFDQPTDGGRSVLWCLTTGENETGYKRSLAFVDAARKKGYPIVYKAYPGLGHVSTANAERLGMTAFWYAVRRRAEARGAYDFRADFKGAEFVVDVVNQRVFPKEDAESVPAAFRLPLPRAFKDSWTRE